MEVSPRGLVRVGFLIPRDLHDEIKKQAKSEQRTKTKVVERALSFYLERQRQVPVTAAQ